MSSQEAGAYSANIMEQVDKLAAERNISDVNE